MAKIGGLRDINKIGFKINLRFHQNINKEFKFGIEGSFWNQKSNNITCDYKAFVLAFFIYIKLGMEVKEEDP